MAGRIANAVEAIGKFRHLVFHSVQGFTDNPDVRDLRRMVLRANKRMEARVNLSVHDFAQMLRLITQMFDPLMKYARTLLTLFPKVQK
jgi:hypothetical protein